MGHLFTGIKVFHKIFSKWMNIIPTSEFLLDNILWLMSIHVHEGGGGG